VCFAWTDPSTPLCLRHYVSHRHHQEGAPRQLSSTYWPASLSPIDFLSCELSRKKRDAATNLTLFSVVLLSVEGLEIRTRAFWDGLGGTFLAVLFAEEGTVDQSRRRRCAGRHIPTIPASLQLFAVEPQRCTITKRAPSLVLFSCHGGT
jgi:hypothetical protein